MDSLFGELTQELAKIAKDQFKNERQGLNVFKRLFKNVTELFEGLDFNAVEFETFEGLFDTKKVAKIEDDLTKLEGYYQNEIFKDLLISFYPILRPYYALRLYDQKMLLSKFYIKTGLNNQKEFEQLKLEAEELRNKTEFDIVLNYVQQNQKKDKIFKKLIPHYDDIAKRFDCYHKNTKKINFADVAREIRRIVGRSNVTLTAINQDLLRLRKKL